MAENQGGGTQHLEGPGRFSCTVRRLDVETVIALDGELDVYSSPQLKDAIDSLPDEAAANVVFDLAAMDFVDSTGLGVLVTALTRAQELGGAVRLRSPNPSTAKLLEITGLGALFAVEPEGSS